MSKRQRGYIERRDYGCDHPESGVPRLLSSTRGCVVDYDSNVDLSAVRGALRWLASDNLELNLSADFTTDDRNPTGTVMVAGTTSVRPNVQPVQGPDGTALSLADFAVRMARITTMRAITARPRCSTVARSSIIR